MRQRSQTSPVLSAPCTETEWVVTSEEPHNLKRDVHRLRYRLRFWVFLFSLWLALVCMNHNVKAQERCIAYKSVFGAPTAVTLWQNVTNRAKLCVYEKLIRRYTIRLVWVIQTNGEDDFKQHPRQTLAIRCSSPLNPAPASENNGIPALFCWIKVQRGVSKSLSWRVGVG